MKMIKIKKEDLRKTFIHTLNQICEKYKIIFNTRPFTLGDFFSKFKQKKKMIIYIYVIHSYIIEIRI